MIVIEVTQADIDAAWAPKTEQARMFHCPLNLAIARAFQLPYRTAYSKVGSCYFSISNAGDYSMYDINESGAAIAFNHNWDRGHPVAPITFTATRVENRNKSKALSAATSGPGITPRRYAKDTETRMAGTDERWKASHISTTSKS